LENDYRPSKISIIEAMEFGNYNLMELMTDGIGFGQQIDKENNDLKIEGK
jgi:hypothetical protein